MRRQNLSILQAGADAGKADPTTWPLVVVGDTRGEMVLDKNEVKLIHDRLAGLTSEIEVSSSGRRQLIEAHSYS